MSLLSQEPFVPHSYQHIVEAGVFPKGAVPEVAYDKFCKEYAALRGEVVVSRITYESDGLTITGLMALPSTITRNAHPVLMFNRGGSGEYGKLTVLNVLRHLAPFVQKGYLVFASNYRGNDGGEGEDEFGGRDLDDVFALLAIAKNHQGFDGKNAYMLGHSRGGMMTYIALKRDPHCVNAAISLAGLSDVRHFRTNHTQADHIERSALCWPQDIHTPLLLLHGDADEAVEVEQSIALNAALKERGKEVELHIYPGGNHSLYRFWDDVVVRSASWMEAHKQ
jgi:dipeptidyl aminopeptidase/acylaminoacyl peptidase